MGMGQTDSLTTLNKTYTMKEMEVRASKILMVDKGDTIIYNADLLRLSSSSMLDELINSLPNTSIDADGQIYVNGEHVRELLIEGRDFFHGDPNIALRNLPAFTVHKVKVYRKAPRDAYLIRNGGSTKALETDPLVMDVRLKAKYKNGIIANAEAGVSVPQRKDDKLMYLGRAFGLQYNKVQSISAHANANNINDTGKPQGRGIWNPSVSNSGIQSHILGGVNYTFTQPENNLNISSALKVMKGMQNSKNRHSSMYYLSDGDIFSSSESEQTSRTLSGEWNCELFFPGKVFTMQLAPHVFVSEGKSQQVLQAASFSKRLIEDQLCDVLDTLFEGIPNNQQIESSYIDKETRELETRAQNINVGGNATFNVKPSFLPRVLKITLDGNYQSIRNNEDSWHRIGYRATGVEDYSRLLHNRLPTRRFTYSLKLQYQLLSFQMDKWKGELNLTYSLSGTGSHRERTSRYIDVPMGEPTYPEPGLDYWPVFQQDDSLWIDDIDNSYYTDEHDFAQTITISGSFNYTDKTALNWSVPCIYNKESVLDERAGIPLQLSRKGALWGPSLSFRFHDFSTGYRFSERMPGLFQFLNRADRSNPLIIDIGNTDLKPQKTHIPYIQFNKRFKKRQAALTVRADYQYVQDKLKRMNYLNTETGVTTFQERNVNGDWLTSIRVNYRLTLDKRRRWNFNSNCTASYGKEGVFEREASGSSADLRTSGYANLNGELSLAYSYKDWRAGMNGTVRWQHSSSMQNYFQPLNYMTSQLGLNVKTPVFHKFSFETDVMYYMKRGGHSNLSNQDYIIWNMKGNWDCSGKLSLQLDAVDILHQLTSVSTGSSTLGWSETWTNTRSSYLMIHVLYRFDFLPK